MVRHWLFTQAHEVLNTGIREESLMEGFVSVQGLRLYLLDNTKNIRFQIFCTIGSNTQIQLVW